MSKERLKAIMGKKLVRRTIVTLSVFLFIFGAGYWAVRMALDQTPDIKDKSVLQLYIAGNLPESLPAHPMGLMASGNATFKKLLDNLDKARVDDRISGIYLRILDVEEMGWAKLEELYAKLKDYKSSGKFLVSYLYAMDEKEYYLALASDAIYMPPEGYVEINGFVTTAYFVKGFFNKIGIEPQVENFGKYKNFLDVLKRENMSEEQREVVNEVLDTTFECFVQTVARDRKMEKSHVEEIIDKGIFRPEDALQAGLIDGLLYPDEMEELLKEKNGNAQQLTRVYGSQYSHVEPKSLGLNKGEKVALIHIVGAIMSGGSGFNPLYMFFPSGGRVTGAYTTNNLLKSARENPDIKAIVLRIDCIGGSVLGSDLIWHEVKKTTEEKPVIVTMSDHAYSGGYYIASPATHIVAHPTTETGSIGVNLNEMSRRGTYEMLGINVETIKRGKFADMYSDGKIMTTEQRKRFKDYVFRAYETFVSRVAEGRKKNWDEIDAIAQGRIWTGAEALKIGLIDELGGLDTAVAAAKRFANIPPEAGVELVTFTPPKGFFQKAIASFTAQAMANPGSNELKMLLWLMRFLQQPDEGETLAAVAPFDIAIE